MMLFESRQNIWDAKTKLFDGEKVGQSAEGVYTWVEWALGENDSWNRVAVPCLRVSKSRLMIGIWARVTRLEEE